MNVRQTIDHINKYIEDNGYHFEKGTVENLYLCLKSKPFAVLTGPSGCGKYSLVRLFCESLGINAANGNFILVSVTENYTASHLIGYKNTNGAFVSGEITDFILKAFHNSETPYFIYLDNMNMSNPDCYLSPIFKALDTRKFTDGDSITSEPVLPGAYFDEKSPYSYLPYPENLYIVGAFTPDDPYYDLSPVIKDRASIIEMRTSDIGMILSKNTKVPEPIEAKNELLKTEYLNAFDSDEEEYMKITSSVLKDINKSLRFIKKEMGYRTRNEILFYLLLNKKHNILSEDAAFDNMMMQRILPRIGGDETYVKTILSTIFKICVPRGVGDYCANSLKMFRALSYLECRYPKSAEKITFMTRRHEEHGNCTFFNA